LFANRPAGSVGGVRVFALFNGERLLVARNKVWP